MKTAKSLKAKAINASVWGGIEKFSFLISQFIISIILARILDPSDFGIIALTTIFITISGAVTDAGFESALIQRKDITKIQINTAFYLNVFLGCFMSLILILTAPYIASYFNNDRLIPILRVLSLLLPLEALGQTQRTLLMKELNLKKLSISQIISSVVGGAIGIALAYRGFGAWALVYSTILTLLIRVVILWIRSSWYPQLVFSFSSVSHLASFGFNVLVTSILYFFMLQFNSIVVGKYYNDKSLGFFNRGMKFPDIINNIIQGVVLKVALPLFAKLQDDESRLEYTLKRTNSIVAFIAFPSLLFLFLNAKEIIIVLLTSKWLPAVVYLKIFCIIKLFEPFITIQRELLLAKGKSRLCLYVFLGTSLLEVIPILGYAKYGISNILYIVLINRFIQFVVYLALNAKGFNNQMMGYLKIFFSFLVISVFVFAGVELFNYFMFNVLNGNVFLKLLLDFILGALLYSLLYFKMKGEDVIIIRGIVADINFSRFKLSKV